MTNELWITDDDQVLQISGMTENHAKNALAMIVSRLKAGESVYISDLGKIQFTGPNATRACAPAVSDFMDATRKYGANMTNDEVIAQMVKDRYGD